MAVKIRLLLLAFLLFIIIMVTFAQFVASERKVGHRGYSTWSEGESHLGTRREEVARRKWGRPGLQLVSEGCPSKYCQKRRDPWLKYHVTARSVLKGFCVLMAFLFSLLKLRRSFSSISYVGF